MKLKIEHHFDYPPDVVADALLEDDFVIRLQALPNVKERKVTELTRKPDGAIRRVVHYIFEGDIPAPVRRVIGAGNVSWDEIGDYDPDTMTWTFRIRPKIGANKFDATGRYRFVSDNGGTRREVDMDLQVKVPIVGRLVEKEIRKGLEETLDEEARLLADYLDGR